MAYVLILEEIERAHTADQMAAGVAEALGGKAEITPMPERIRQFDEWLVSKPKPGDLEADDWNRAMGLLA